MIWLYRCSIRLKFPPGDFSDEDIRRGCRRGDLTALKSRGVVAGNDSFTTVVAIGFFVAYLRLVKGLFLSCVMTFIVFVLGAVEGGSPSWSLWLRAAVELKLRTEFTRTDYTQTRLLLTLRARLTCRS